MERQLRKRRRRLHPQYVQVLAPPWVKIRYDKKEKLSSLCQAFSAPESFLDNLVDALVDSIKIVGGVDIVAPVGEPLTPKMLVAPVQLPVTTGALVRP